VKKKKSLGQHFLIDHSILHDIAAEVNVIKFKNILEIGPGEGALTSLLLESNPNLFVLEKDDRLPAILQSKFPVLKGKIIHEDALTADWSQAFDGDGFLLVGNFPYNISSQLMFKMLDYKEQVQYMVGMFQKEVAARICAKPSTKQYGVITILIQLYYKATYLFDVPAHAFEPPPKVVSGVIRLERNSELDGQFDYELVRRVVKMAFNQRRKKLSNALGAISVNWEKLPNEFANKRADHLSVRDYINLSKHVEF